MGRTKQDIIKEVKENDVNFIRLQFTDIFGMLKNVAITASQLEKALNNEVMFDGSSIEGFSRIEESDMYLYPDINTFTILPWRPHSDGVARMICDIHKPNGSPFEGDPRYILKKVIKEAADMGYTLSVGPECEFFLFNTDEKGRPTTYTNDDGGYFDLAPVDNGENARRDICLTLGEMNFEIEASHHEVAAGQHEIDFKYSDALTTADNIVTFKLVVKTIAKKHGLFASFMPKPVFGINGSGMHTNMSLQKDGKNAFCDENDSLGLSTVAYQFIAGLLEHISAMTSVTNPLVNSYKRLVPGYEAPCYIAWSTSNRTPLIRIPASRGNGTRVELRSPDPSANPYLAIALCLAAGLDGIKRKLPVPKSIDTNIFRLSNEEKAAMGIKSLPASLGEAVALTAEDSFCRTVLGEHVHSKFTKAKLREHNEYSIHVSPWEIDRYLGQY